MEKLNKSKELPFPGGRKTPKLNYILTDITCRNRYGFYIKFSKFKLKKTL